MTGTIWPVGNQLFLNWTFQPVPEPSALLAVAAAALGRALWKRFSPKAAASSIR